MKQTKKKTTEKSFRYSFHIYVKRVKLIKFIKAKNKKILERRCKIYHFLQYEENGNVLFGKRQSLNHSKS